MATPGNYVLSIYRGDTHRWRFVLWADAGKTQQSDLTGAVVEAQIQMMGSPVINLGCTVTLPNVVDALLSAPDSKKLSSGRGLWDMQVTLPSGDVTTVLRGDVMITADVTVVGGEAG